MDGEAQLAGSTTWHMPVKQSGLTAAIYKFMMTLKKQQSRPR